jgi:hypothetical protein
MSQVVILPTSSKPNESGPLDPIDVGNYKIFFYMISINVVAYSILTHASQQISLYLMKNPEFSQGGQG